MSRCATRSHASCVCPLVSNHTQFAREYNFPFISHVTFELCILTVSMRTPQIITHATAANRAIQSMADYSRPYIITRLCTFRFAMLDCTRIERALLTWRGRTCASVNWAVSKHIMCQATRAPSTYAHWTFEHLYATQNTPSLCLQYSDWILPIASQRESSARAAGKMYSYAQPIQLATLVERSARQNRAYAHNYVNKFPVSCL